MESRYDSDLDIVQFFILLMSKDSLVYYLFLLLRVRYIMKLIIVLIYRVGSLFCLWPSRANAWCKVLQTLPKVKILLYKLYGR